MPRERTSAAEQRRKNARNKDSIGSPGVVSANLQAVLPSFAGNFDLFDKEATGFDGILQSVQGTLYEKIREYQSADMQRARVYISPPNDDRHPSRIIDCSEDVLAEASGCLLLDSVKFHRRLPLVGSNTRECGISSSFAVEDACFITLIGGTFRMSRLSTGAKGGDKEVFEGHVAYAIRCSELYARTGDSTQQYRSWSFWAIRARIDAKGHEIGVQAGIPSGLARANRKPLVLHPSRSLSRSRKTAARAHPDDPIDFLGAFKLYDMSLIFSLGLPYEPFPSYRQIYRFIQDSKVEIGLKCLFQESLLPPCHGFMSGPAVTDLNDDPLNLTISSLERHERLSFRSEENREFVPNLGRRGPKGPGLVATFHLSEEYDSPGVYSASGYIKLIRVYSNVEPSGKLFEIFEAYLKVDMRVDPRAYKRRYGEKSMVHRQEAHFLAVRGREHKLFD